MRLFPRQNNGTATTAANDVVNLFSTLSLAVANYKPFPVLPSSSGGGGDLSAAGTGSGSGSGSGGSSFAKASGASPAAGAAAIFQVQSSPAALQLANQNLSAAAWGEPSVLYVPAGAAPESSFNASSNGNGSNRMMSNGNTFADNKARMGPGNCPVIDKEYMPQGGWDALPPPDFPPFDPVKANIMRYRQQVGVNLGSWFVQENWMEPSFFACSTGGKAGEYDVLDGYGQSPDGVRNATAKMSKHWDTWITEADFVQMASIGINTVRLPIGYWSAGPYFTHNSPFEAYKDVYQFSWRYVARAINWAAKYDMGVIVDLHGAYGSQNGQSHSGLSDGNIQFYNQYNMDLTKELLVWLAKEISDVTNVVGIQLLNEPQNRDSLWPWYNATMDAMRAASPEAATVPLYFHDAFVLSKGAQFVSQRSDFVVQDHHSYYVYTASDTAESAQGHVQGIHGPVQEDLTTQSARARRNLIIGEWSCALAPSSLGQSDNPQRDQTSFCGAQNLVYSNTTSGWTFWSYKMENCDDNPGWCFQSAIKNFLSTPFNAWGLPDVIATQFATLDTDAKAAFTQSLTQQIRAIKLPVLPNTLQQQVPAAFPATAADVAAAAPDATDATAAQDAAAAPAVDAVAPSAPFMSEPAGRVGMTFGGSSSSGSLAARAAAIVRREQQQQQQQEEEEQEQFEMQQQQQFLAQGDDEQSPAADIAVNDEAAADPAIDAAQLQMQAQMQTTKPLSAETLRLLASNSGYSDGFLSAKIFASSTSLSRLGFGLQYMHDSWSARIQQGRLAGADESAYQDNFIQGIQDAESAIVLALQTALTPAKSS